ncbi:MAG TPA: hypothetical protein VK986_09175, partial [Tepidisphaeraceae bacterium]|nr:hypothetical protein [Tepidisphaeraceae bacterium]
FNGSKYTSYLAATPEGVVCWAYRGDSNGPAGVWRLGKDGWSELKTTGEALPKPVTDGSTITVVGMRLLLTTTKGEKGVAHSGQVWAVDLKSGAVTKRDPAGREGIAVERFARESVYLPKSEMVMFGYALGKRVPFYDVAKNRWLAAAVEGSEFFAHAKDGVSVDLGLQYDAGRDLVWAVMCNLKPGSVRVLRVAWEGMTKDEVRPPNQ